MHEPHSVIVIEVLRNLHSNSLPPGQLKLRESNLLIPRACNHYSQTIQRYHVLNFSVIVTANPETSRQDSFGVNFCDKSVEFVELVVPRVPYAD